MMTKKRAQELASEAARHVPREITLQKVAGSGGRLRTVAICEAGCWHGSHGQAKRCKNAHWVAVRRYHGDDWAPIEPEGSAAPPTGQ